MYVCTLSYTLLLVRAIVYYSTSKSMVHNFNYSIRMSEHFIYKNCANKLHCFPPLNIYTKLIFVKQNLLVFSIIFKVFKFFI